MNLRDLYTSLKLSYFPLKDGTKEPAVSQGFRSPKDEIERVLKQNPNCNLGIVCGQASDNLVVLDFESDKDAWLFFEKEAILRNSLVVRTCHGGIHVYLKTLLGETVRRQTKLCAPDHSFDVCGEGGYVAAPPSVINHELCKVKLKGEVDKCPHTKTTSSYFIISKVRTIQTISGLEDSIRKKCASLKWNLKTESSIPGSVDVSEAFKQLLDVDPKLRATFEGKEIPKSRSEAEFALSVRLLKYHFSESEIYAILEQSGIGKWKEKDESYKRRTIERARLAVMKDAIDYRIAKSQVSTGAIKTNAKW